MATIIELIVRKLGGNTTAVHGFDVPSGVYFVTADEGPAKGMTKKVVKVR